MEALISLLGVVVAAIGLFAAWKAYIVSRSSTVLLSPGVLPGGHEPRESAHALA